MTIGNCLLLETQVFFVNGNFRGTLKCACLKQDKFSLHKQQMRQQQQQFNCGDLVVSVTSFSSPSIIVSSSNNVLWQTENPFLSVSDPLNTTTATTPPVLNGNFQNIPPATYLLSCSPTITSMTSNNGSNNNVMIEGDIPCLSSTFIFNITCFPQESYFQWNILVNDQYQHQQKKKRYVRINFLSDAKEGFYGMGEQFNYLNLRGKKVPMIVSEQGVGHGLEPLTDYYNNNITSGSGGYWFTTYAPKPVFITNRNRGVLVEDSFATMFDFTAGKPSQQQPSMETVSIEFWSNQGHATVFYTNNENNGWFDLITTLTQFTGRPTTVLPAWSQEGAIVGLEGGTNNVTAIVNKLLQQQVNIAGVWLQDWVGMRHSWDGDRLIWNWEVNSDWYPQWNEMVDSWSKQQQTEQAEQAETNKMIRVLTYVSPFFSNPLNYTSASALHHNFYQEGIDNGYFVMKYKNNSESNNNNNNNNNNSNLIPYVLSSLSIDFCMVDLTNTAAVTWMKNILKNQLMIEAGSAGWMCDFGEYLPYDAVLHDGTSPDEYHNLYPEMWAKLTQEAIQEAGKTDEVVFFMRSAWTHSSRYVSLFWLGDQLQSWDGYDGLLSSVTAALSSGLSGHAITHSDIGGYNAVTTAGNNNSGLYFVRSEELLQRWSEFAAFGSALYRTHIGSSTAHNIPQIYDNNNTITHFAKFANIFAFLSSYRGELMLNATQFGWPLIRPMVLHYPNDSYLWTMMNNVTMQSAQYMFGSDFIVVPAVTQQQQHCTIYLPKQSGTWIHLWSGVSLPSNNNNENEGTFETNSCPVGFPFVVYRNNSAVGVSLRKYVVTMGYDSGYVWNNNVTSSTSPTTSPTTATATRKGKAAVSPAVAVIGTMIPICIFCVLAYVWLGNPGVSTTTRTTTSYSALDGFDPLEKEEMDTPASSSSNHSRGVFAAAVIALQQQQQQQQTSYVPPSAMKKSLSSGSLHNMQQQQQQQQQPLSLKSRDSMLHLHKQNELS